MITAEEILPFGRFKYALPFTGSHNGMRYKIVHPKPNEGEENLIYVDVWPGPLCHDKADQASFIKTTFPYSKEGYDEILPYLNKLYEDNMDKWPKSVI